MILGIESSCDETALALFDRSGGVVREWINSQIVLHREYGGIVPDLASREHLENFPILLREMTDWMGKRYRIEEIAVTVGPGLAGCLALGVAVAKSLALAWQVPLCGVNHLRGHVFSPFMSMHEKSGKAFAREFQKSLPHLGLIVSGGNTILARIGTDRQVEMIAETVDDAAGEALDKGAKLLGLSYPGGPIMERLSESGDPRAVKFPRAFHDSNEMKFSFSGLKTSLRYRLEKLSDKELQSALPDICAGYQQAVVDALVRKTKQAMQNSDFKSIGLSGGVANNLTLRMAFKTLAKKHGLDAHFAHPEHTGDNAAMIAFASFIDPSGTLVAEGLDLTIHPSLPLTNRT